MRGKIELVCLVCLCFGDAKSGNAENTLGGLHPVSGRVYFFGVYFCCYTGFNSVYTPRYSLTLLCTGSFIR